MANAATLSAPPLFVPLWSTRKARIHVHSGTWGEGAESSGVGTVVNVDMPASASDLPTQQQPLTDGSATYVQGALSDRGFLHTFPYNNIWNCVVDCLVISSSCQTFPTRKRSPLSPRTAVATHILPTPTHTCDVLRIYGQAVEDFENPSKGV